MTFIKEKISDYNITRYYSLEHVNSLISAVNWLSEVRNIDGIMTKHIDYSDEMNRSDEGSNSIQFSGKTDLDILKQEINNRSIDRISLTGKYKEKPVVIGIVLPDYMVGITIRQKDPADLESLEKLLKLV